MGKPLKPVWIEAGVAQQANESDNGLRKRKSSEGKEEPSKRRNIKNAEGIPEALHGSCAKDSDPCAEGESFFCKTSRSLMGSYA